MAWTTATPKELFFTKNDPKDPRLGEWAQPQTLTSPDDIASGPSSWVVLGYPDDEGIAINGGRVGAKEAPNAIRTPFYKMTPSLLRPQPVEILDVGNLAVDVPLAERHERGRQIIRTALTKGHRTIGVGGGHDYGFADGAGFLDVYARPGEPKPVIINFDAHLDVRPTDRGLSSGTPFFRLLGEFENRFEFIEVGLQNQCNSLDHLQWAQARGAQTILLEDLREVGLQKSLEVALAPFAGRACFLSIDIDAFTNAEAPGCSQSWATGLTIQEVLPALDYVREHLDLRSFAIYEVSPALDTDHRTSKLAALLMHHLIF